MSSTSWSGIRLVNVRHARERQSEIGSGATSTTSRTHPGNPADLTLTRARRGHATHLGSPPPPACCISACKSARSAPPRRRAEIPNPVVINHLDPVRLCNDLERTKRTRPQTERHQRPLGLGRLGNRYEGNPRIRREKAQNIPQRSPTEFVIAWRLIAKRLRHRLIAHRHHTRRVRLGRWPKLSVNQWQQRQQGKPNDRDSDAMG